VGVGLASLAVGGGLYGAAIADERSARDASDVDDYADHIERAATFSRAGIAMLAIGGALTLAGIIRWSVLGARARKTRDTAIGPTSTLRF
jgi:hypothetical protein